MAGLLVWSAFAATAWVASLWAWPAAVAAVVLSAGVFFLPGVRLVIRPAHDLTLYQGQWCGLWSRKSVIPLDSIASARFERRLSYHGRMQQDHFLNIALKDGSAEELLPSGFLPWKVDRFTLRRCDRLGVEYEKRLDTPRVDRPAA